MSKNTFLLLLFCFALVSLLCLTSSASANKRRGPERMPHRQNGNQNQDGNHHQSEQEHRDHLIDPKDPQQPDQPVDNHHHQDEKEHRDHLVDPQADQQPEREQEEPVANEEPAEEVEPETSAHKRHHPSPKDHKKDHHHGKKHDSDDDDDEDDDDDDDEKGDEHGKNRHQLLKDNCSAFFKDPKKKGHHSSPPVVHCVQSCEWLNENYKKLYHDKEQKKDPKTNDEKYSTHVVFNPEFSVSKCVNNAWKCPAKLIPEVDCTTAKGCNYPRPFPHAYCKDGHWKKPCWFSRLPRWVIHIVVAGLIMFFFLLSSFVFIRCVHSTRAPKGKSDGVKKGKSIDSEEEGVTLVPQPY